MCVGVVVSLFLSGDHKAVAARALTHFVIVHFLCTSKFNFAVVHIARVRFVHFVCVFCGFSWIITFNYIFECRAVLVLASNFSVAREYGDNFKIA